MAEGILPPELQPWNLLRAYRTGLFPMDVCGAIEWFRPDPRAVFALDRFHIPRRLARLVRRRPFRFSLDRAFDEVIAGCAVREEGTWISPELAAAYRELHRRGHAHSLEAWQAGTLVGGIYGVALGGAFFGESMFSRVSNASKLCLVELVGRMRGAGFELFDIQFVNPHLEQFRPILLPARIYRKQLQRALRLRCTLR